MKIEVTQKMIDELKLSPPEVKIIGLYQDNTATAIAYIRKQGLKSTLKDCAEFIHYLERFTLIPSSVPIHNRFLSS